ncbi:cell wall hydrolase [Methylobacterium sp. 77]|uniref:cell wall hydrolase n=1 Tax=Methylobacterium sp. 77 TaxID=1101192 RepID=UPI0032AECDA2
MPLSHDTPGTRRRTDVKATERLYPNHAARGPNDTAASLLNVGLAGSDGDLLIPGSAIWTPDFEPTAGFTPPARDDETEVPSDGSTPAIPRAIALSSTTPAPADATPIEVAAASLMFPGFSPQKETSIGGGEAAPDDARHRYADLIGPDAMDREQRCLAEAVYFEARSEPEEGQAAVAQVVLNRVKSGLYPSNVCGVVYQNRHRYMGCQFSFACEGKSLHITDGPSWQSATRIASAVIEGRTYLSEVGGATHYHADYVKPGWSRRLKKMDVIGRHIFYQLKRGQT